MLINTEVLSSSYLPDRLLHRDKERTELANNLKNFINTFVHGPCGSGKTILVKHVIRDLNDKIITKHIDCSVYQTTYSALKEIIPKSELIFSRSNYELTKELIRYAKAKRFIVCFDNFEKLKEKDLIAKLMSLNLCVVLISGSKENFSLLSENLRTNIPSTISLPTYTAEQSFDILKDRAEKALAKWTYTDAIIKKISENINGNLALGINTLKLAALKAESENKKVLEEADIQIKEDCAPALSHDEKVILDVLKEWKSLPASRLYDFYIQQSKHPKGERSFRNYMESLCSKNLVKAVGEKRGRVYELIEVKENVEEQSEEHPD
jgi:Cdc6-like AAA superfamily ATPase